MNFDKVNKEAETRINKKKGIIAQTDEETTATKERVENKKANLTKIQEELEAEKQEGKIFDKKIAELEGKKGIYRKSTIDKTLMKPPKKNTDFQKQNFKKN